jgi:hypothetical protein
MKPSGKQVISTCNLAGFALAGFGFCEQLCPSKRRWSDGVFASG